MTSSSLLLIDHDPGVQHLIETAFTTEGFDVNVVGDGLSALDATLASGPNVILADYRMAGMNVLRFLEKLKQKNLLKNITVFLLINPGDVFDELTLRLMGVADFLSKPLKSPEMVERVRRYLPASAPAPVASARPEPPAAEADTMKIEDLLGWSSASPQSPFSELGEERSAGIDLSLGPPTALPASSDEPLFFEQNEDTPSNAFASDNAEPAGPGAMPSAVESNAAAPPCPSEDFALAEAGRAEFPTAPVNGLQASEVSLPKDVVEKVAWELVPQLAQRSLEQILKTVVERVVWETVPLIAEAAIKQEIDRLKTEDTRPTT